MALKSGTDALTGTTIFPNAGETPAKVLDVKPVPPPDTGKPAVSFAPLAPMRLAEPLE
jgi:methylmalonyl-CoA mutase